MTEDPRIPCWTIIQTKDGWVVIDAEDVSEPLPDLADALDKMMDDLEEE